MFKKKIKSTIEEHFPSKLFEMKCFHFWSILLSYPIISCPIMVWNKQGLVNLHLSKAFWNVLLMVTLVISTAYLSSQLCHLHLYSCPLMVVWFLPNSDCPVHIIYSKVHKNWHFHRSTAVWLNQCMSSHLSVWIVGTTKDLLGQDHTPRSAANQKKGK